MKKASLLTALLVFLVIASLSFTQFSCNQPAEQKADSAAAPKQMTQAEMVLRGKYIVTTSACNDCHTPKIFTPQGPLPDTTKLLSGHPGAQPLPPIDKKA